MKTAILLNNLMLELHFKDGISILNPARMNLKLHLYKDRLASVHNSHEQLLRFAFSLFNICMLEALGFLLHLISIKLLQEFVCGWMWGCGERELIL